MMMSSETTNHRAPHGGNAEQIYNVLRSASRSMSAYEILDALRGTSIKAAVQVYRGLDRLISQRRVHRIESLNAFVVCSCESHSSPAGFFICDLCDTTVEFDPAFGLGMMQSAVKGFHIRQVNVELHGLCSRCVAQEHNTP